MKQIRRIATETHGERNETTGMKLKRVADEEWRERAKGIAEDAAGLDSDGDQEVVADGGRQVPPEEPEHDPATPLRIERGGD